MKISDVRVVTVRIPLKVPKRFATRTVSYRDYTIATVFTDEGLVGWGYCWGTLLVSIAIEELLREVLIGEDPFAINRLWNKMYKAMAVWDRRGISSRAIAAIDIALWDLLGRACGMPIYRLLGGFRDKVPAYYSGGYYPVNCSTDAELLGYLEKEFSTYVQKGFKAFKMKVGGVSLSLDLKRIELARKIIGDEADLMIDANNVWDPDTAIAIARQLEKYRIRWLEEPVAIDDLVGCARVAANVPMPVAIGENHFTRWDFREIVDRKAASILQGDPTLMGGITEWLNLAGVAATYGLILAPHWTHDLNVQVGAARPEVLYIEYFELESDVFNFQRLLKNPVKASDGFVRPPDGPGHGLELDEDAVKHYAYKGSTAF
ncbi:MAG TPA: mandelate racemase/muconate lactonizing enzyme family protein [Firmicutes bacterium]|nr:mandelate racemase/muconate lactonizing enzyme family protein [Bacillota bacterium]